MGDAAQSEVPLAVLHDRQSSTATSPAPAVARSDTGQQEKVAQNTASAAGTAPAPAPAPAPMGECNTEYRGLPGANGEDTAASVPTALRKVSIVPLVFLIFYEVSGGPFGIEDSVGAAGPLLAIVGFLVLPVVWSVPEALITAELGTMFPENGGYVVWVASALGPYWGFQQGWMKWLSGVIDNALYPVLFLDYLKSAVPALGGGAPRAFAVLGLTAVLTLLNYRGLTVVGWVAICLGVFSLLPFFVMGLISLPKLRPARWLVVDLHDVDWNLYLNTLFWNLNYWDKASTLAGEVEEPRRTFPRAVFGAVGLVVGAYLVPLLAGTGALPSETAAEWTDGFFSEVGQRIGGTWLRVWIQAAAAMSNMGLFEAEMSSDSFQLLGMAEMGMIPAIFARRSRHGTPTFSILCSATGVVILSFMSFQEIIEFLNFLYGLGMLAVFAAFVKLRAKDPDLPRPYRIPVGTAGAAVMCVPPVLLITTVMCLASARTFIVNAVVVLASVALYYGVEHAKRHAWVEFLAPLPPADSSHGSATAPDDADLEDVRAGLLADDDDDEGGGSKVE